MAKITTFEADFTKMVSYEVEETLQHNTELYDFDFVNEEALKENTKVFTWTKLNSSFVTTDVKIDQKQP